MFNLKQKHTENILNLLNENIPKNIRKTNIIEYLKKERISRQLLSSLYNELLSELEQEDFNQKAFENTQDFVWQAEDVELEEYGLLIFNTMTNLCKNPIENQYFDLNNPVNPILLNEDQDAFIPLTNGSFVKHLLMFVQDIKLD